MDLTPELTENGIVFSYLDTSSSEVEVRFNHFNSSICITISH